MVYYGLLIDNRKCIGCHACTVAGKSEHDCPIGVNITHVKYIEKGTYPDVTREFSVHRSNHCEDPSGLRSEDAAALLKGGPRWLRDESSDAGLGVAGEAKEEAWYSCRFILKDWHREVMSAARFFEMNYGRN